MFYTTKQGQTWDQIALATLGSELQMHRLMEANPTHRHTVFFSAGTVLTIPAQPTPSDNSEFLPPWKK